MIISHFKKTPIAHAPEAISEVINKYTNHSSRVYGYGYPNSAISSNTDILHQHNSTILSNKKSLIQYHSEPFRVNLNVDIPKLVIAQYHATLPEYSDCTIVRNPIDLYKESFFPKYQSSKIRIGYSPSTLDPKSVWADKGYYETVPILNSIKNKFKDLVEIDVIINVPLEECLYRKSLCNIFIDEVKTPSYHRSGLESLAMGIATICSISPGVESVLLKSCNSKSHPFINVNHINLEEKLSNLINSGLDEILKIGYNSRVWMEKYWDPRIIAEEYIEIYKKIKDSAK